MSRRLNRDNRTKIRNIPRRLRALNRWAEEIMPNYPADYADCERYWNIKIPVDINLVQGKYSTARHKAACAQAMINACARLLKLTAEDTRVLRTTCVICLPDMFTSEICHYFSEEYFQSFITEGKSRGGIIHSVRGRSLAEEIGLKLPPGIEETGVIVEISGSDDPDDNFLGERWYYGEVL